MKVDSKDMSTSKYAESKDEIIKIQTAIKTFLAQKRVSKLKHNVVTEETKNATSKLIYLHD